MIPNLDLVLGRVATGLTAAGYRPSGIDEYDRQLEIDVAGTGELHLTITNVELILSRGKPVLHIPPVPFDERRRQGRERAVRCRYLGCTNTTWNVTALCGRHLESEEPVAPRRLTAVDLAVRSGDVDVPPVGAHPPADRGHTLTA